MLEDFLTALRAEYVEGKGAKVGTFMEGLQITSKQDRVLNKLESKVRKASQAGQQEAEAAIEEIRATYAANDQAQLFSGAATHRGAGSGTGSSPGSSSSSSSSNGSDSDGGEDLLGGCVQVKAQRPPTDTPYLVTAVTPTSDFGAVFVQTIEACGVQYLGCTKTSPRFLEAVAEVTSQILSPGAEIISEQQIKLIQNCYRYKALCPVSHGDDDHAPSPRGTKSYSICDRIGQCVESQPMEVLEHVLHHITDVGMHHLFPAEWGLSEGSSLHSCMLEAIEKGLYEVSDYEEEIVGEPEVLLRVELQEFGYWLITTAWDLQAEFGPFDPIDGSAQAEWKVRTAAEMQELLPSSLELYKRTVVPTMCAPTRETLEALRRYGVEAFGRQTKEFEDTLMAALLQHADQSDQDLQAIAKSFPHAPVGTFLQQDPSAQLLQICADYDRQFTDPLFSVAQFMGPDEEIEGAMGEHQKATQQREPLKFTRLSSHSPFVPHACFKTVQESRTGQAGILGRLKQGQWGSCKLTSFVVALACDPTHAELLDFMLRPITVEAMERGLAVLRLWVAPLSQWRFVVMDDQVPLLLLGSSGTRGMHGYTLLEKAWIKAAGGFTVLNPDSGSDSGSNDGTSSDSDDGDDVSGDFVDDVPKCMGFEPLNRRGLHLGWQGPDKSSDGPASSEECFELLIKAHTAGEICCLSGFDRRQVDDCNLGIIGGHDYSVLRVEQHAADLCMLRLRNPWGHSAWEGRFSCADTVSWTPELRQLLDYDPEGCEDGSFWIEASDMFKHFEGANLYTRSSVLRLDIVD